MKVIESDIHIIGAGLTGLTLAYLLRSNPLKIVISEARLRLGGRIHTSYAPSAAPIELGATWLGRKHKSLVELLNQLGIGMFEQQLGNSAIYEPISTSPHQLVSLPPNSDPSYRIAGGTTRLISELAKHIESDRIHLGEAIHSIEENKNQLSLEGASKRFQANLVICTLASSSIS